MEQNNKGRRKAALIKSSKVKLQYNRTPAVFIFSSAVLNILQTGIKFQASFTNFLAVAILSFGLHIVNKPDRGDNRRRSAGTSLLESS